MQSKKRRRRGLRRLRTGSPTADRRVCLDLSAGVSANEFARQRGSGENGAEMAIDERHPALSKTGRIAAPQGVDVAVHVSSSNRNRARAVELVVEQYRPPTKEMASRS